MPGALEDPELGRVAVLDGVLELLLDGQVALAVALDERDLVPLAMSSRARFQPDLAAAGDDHVHRRRALHSIASACSNSRSRLRRADRVQALLGVPVRARRVQHAAR